MSNLKLKHTPKSLVEALKVLDGQSEMVIGYATKLHTEADGTVVYATHHDNRIVEYSEHGVSVSWAGWATPTTTSRLNMLAPGRFNISQRKPHVNGEAVSDSHWHKVS